MVAWYTRALSTPIAQHWTPTQHWTPVSLRSGLHFVSLHSLETLRFSGTDLERVGEPITAAQRRWFWVDTCNAVTLTEDGVLYAVDNVGGLWRRDQGGELVALTPVGVEAHPAPGPRAQRHRSALAFEPTSRTLVIAGGQTRTDSYTFAAGASDVVRLEGPKLPRGDATAFADPLRVWHFAEGALSELVGRAWTRVVTHRGAGPRAQAMFRDPLRDRWLHVEQHVSDGTPAVLRLLTPVLTGALEGARGRARLGEGRPLPGDLVAALSREAGTALGHDPVSDTLVHVVGAELHTLPLGA